MGNIDWPRDGKQIFVGGEWRVLDEADVIESISPIDETVVGLVAAARPQHVDLAVQAIEPALAEWGGLGAVERTAYLRRFADVLTEHREELAGLETLDAGLTARTADGDVTTAIRSLAFYSGFATEIQGRTHPTPDDTLAITVREPYGIAARIVPFNHPLMFAVQNAAPALVAGNAVIVKPPEQCSLSSLALAELARSVFPPGVFNVITGYGHEAGAGIVEHPKIRRIGFTGSVPTARRILEGAAKHIKLVTLELGGKNPLVICGDADPDFAAKVALRGMNFTHAGQSCQSTTRVLIEGDIYEDVVQRLAAGMASLVVGDPREARTDVGPVAFRAHYERVMSYIEAGKADGATIRTGGGRPEGQDKGFYIQPTLFADVTQDMRIAREEIFGPVVCAMAFKSVDDAVALANDTEYGLTSRVLAGDLRTAISIGRRLEAGTTLVNTAGQRPRGMPFGGYKESGLGKQACLEEVLSYTQEKSIVIGLG